MVARNRRLPMGVQAGIEGVEEGGAVGESLSREEGLDKFEIAHRDLVEFEGRGVFLEAKGIDVEGVVFLRGADVVEHDAGGDGGGFVADQTEALEGTDMKLALDERNGKVAGPHPVFDAGAGGNALELRWNGGGCGEQDLAGPGHEDFIDSLLAGGGAGEFGGAEFAGGNVEEGDGAEGAVRRGSARPLFQGVGFGVEAGLRIGGRLFGMAGRDFKIGSQEIVLFLAECGVERGARRKDARDFAAHDLFGELGIFHLVADGDAVALAQEAREVAFDGVVGDAAHGLVAFAVAGREGELELAADDDRVVVEQLVEIPHAEEEQGIGILALGDGPLAHERG